MNWLTQPLAWPDGAALNEVLRAWLQGGWSEWVMQPAKALVACAALLFTLGALGVWLLWPSDGQDVQALTLAHQALQTQLVSQRQRLAALQLQASVSTGPARALSAAQSAWPTRAQVQAALMVLHLQAQKHGLQVELFKPEGMVSSEGLSAQALHLRLRGSFAQIAAWSEAVFQQPALWVPEKWKLSAQPGAQEGMPSPSQVSLDALLHVYVRPIEDGTQQAQAMDPAFGETAQMPVKNVANSDAKPEVQRDAQRHAQRPGPSPTGDPFSRPASKAFVPAGPLPLGEDVHALRRWPLQDLTMVGSFSSGGALSALVLSPMGLFRVTVGDVLGIEGARIVSLNPLQLDLRMPVPTDNGRWTERQAVLPMRAAVKP